MANPIHAPTSTCSMALHRERTLVSEALSASGTVSKQSLPRVLELLRCLCSYCERGFGAESLADIEPEHARSFVLSPTSSGDPAPATSHLRRSILRLVFRMARQLDLVDSDPTLDLALPPRSQLKTRPLTTDEVDLCRASSLHTIHSTRLPAAWALAEASARSSELGYIRIRDVDLDGQQVWFSGSRRTAARWVPLSAWGRLQLERRIRALDDDPETPLVYEGTEGSDYHRQAASCVAIADTLRRAGLAAEPDVRPSSVVAWAGGQVLDETGRIEEVARRLGVRSLDRAARMIEWDWTNTPTDLDG